jgi:hypothetical protein
MNNAQLYDRLKNLGIISVNSYQIFMFRINIHIEIRRRFGIFQFEINLIACDIYNADFDEDEMILWAPDETYDSINYMDELD